MLPSVFNTSIWESDTVHLLWCCSVGREFVISQIVPAWYMQIAHTRGMPSTFNHCPPTRGRAKAVHAQHVLGDTLGKFSQHLQARWCPWSPNSFTVGKLFSWVIWHWPLFAFWHTQWCLGSPRKEELISTQQTQSKSVQTSGHLGARCQSRYRTELCGLDSSHRVVSDHFLIQSLVLWPQAHCIPSSLVHLSVWSLN